MRRRRPSGPSLGLSPSGKVSELLGFLGTGLGLQLDHPPLLALGLTLFLPSLYALARTWMQSRGLQLEVRRPERARALEPSPVSLRVHSGGAVPSLLVRDRARPTLGVLEHMEGLGPGESRAARSFEVFTRRGPVKTAPLTMTCSRPLGLAVSRRTGKDVHDVIVLPPLGRLSSRLARLTLGGRPAHERPAPRRGLGAEIRTLRPYVPGDSCRHIHWPTSARANSLMVREWEDDDDRGVLVIGIGWRISDHPQHVVRVEAAVSFASTLLHRSRRHVVLLLPGEAPHRVRSGDERGRLAAEERLAVLGPDPGWPDWGGAAGEPDVTARLLLHPGTAPLPPRPPEVRPFDVGDALLQGDFVPQGARVS